MLDMFRLVVQFSGLGFRSSDVRDMPVEQVMELALDNPMTPEVFEILREDKGFREILCELDVAETDQYNLFLTLDQDGSGELDVEEMIDGISKLRGEAQRSDVVAVNFKLNALQQKIEEQFGNITDMIAMQA